MQPDHWALAALFNADHQDRMREAADHRLVANARACARANPNRPIRHLIGTALVRAGSWMLRHSPQTGTGRV